MQTCISGSGTVTNIVLMLKGAVFFFSIPALGQYQSPKYVHVFSMMSLNMVQIEFQVQWVYVDGERV